MDARRTKKMKNLWREREERQTEKEKKDRQTDRQTEK